MQDTKVAPPLVLVQVRVWVVQVEPGVEVGLVGGHIADESVLLQVVTPLVVEQVKLLPLQVVTPLLVVHLTLLV